MTWDREPPRTAASLAWIVPLAMSALGTALAALAGLLLAVPAALAIPCEKAKSCPLTSAHPEGVSCTSRICVPWSESVMNGRFSPPLPHCNLNYIIAWQPSPACQF